MVTQFDEKGKFFTDIIQKEPVWVTLQLATNRIHGLIHIRNESRIKEELDDTATFLPVTQAEIFSVDGSQHLFSTRFLAINKGQIIWLTSDNDAASTHLER